MKVELRERILLVIREDGDPKYYGVRNAVGESKLLYAIKNELNRQGFDFIKKRMAKDGHMMDGMQQYLRERRATNGRMLAIYNPRWQIEGAEREFNRGKLTLAVENISK